LARKRTDGESVQDNGGDHPPQVLRGSLGRWRRAPKKYKTGCFAQKKDQHAEGCEGTKSTEIKGRRASGIVVKKRRETVKAKKVNSNPVTEIERQGRWVQVGA